MNQCLFSFPLYSKAAVMSGLLWRASSVLSLVIWVCSTATLLSVKDVFYVCLKCKQP